jgi:hypothetical protein
VLYREVASVISWSGVVAFRCVVPVVLAFLLYDPIHLLECIFYISKIAVTHLHQFALFFLSLLVQLQPRLNCVSCSSYKLVHPVHLHRRAVPLWRLLACLSWSPRRLKEFGLKESECTRICIITYIYDVWTSSKFLCHNIYDMKTPSFHITCR